ncbi:OX-2 membrane glycoprotein-like isoform X2 [Girardinichthys multiradiatus]|uniref:OX-2 membrane glycoprotein-like isoform X2 n=1 Tax=Girardinichthys multiradiatus TaxID=208333 RepID=UPI001FAD0685|nr:OX-2 membrane glycoprotein-like isoform X2 [Girardinichthys multiradiatus]
MSDSVVPFFFFLLEIFFKGLADPIKTEKSVLAAEGEDAPLSCQLLETKDVQQVTWQKVLEKTERNICTYSEFFGETVDPDFKEKVQFTEAGLQKSSIVIRSVTEQDEGCYLCLFNIYPDGALTAGTCLMVYELHEPILDVRRSNSPTESVVSCSATGRPAPSVTLTVLHQNLSFSQYTSTSVTNSNGTVTITTTALLSAFSSTEVGCSVSVLSAAPRELLVTVPGLTETSEDGLDKQTGSSDRRSKKDFRGGIRKIPTMPRTTRSTSPLSDNVDLRLRSSERKTKHRIPAITVAT